MFHRFVSEHDLAAIACAARRINKDDEAFTTLRTQMEDLIKAEQTALSSDDLSERRAALCDILSSCLAHDLDRLTAVSSALTALHALQEKSEIPAEGEAVTNENYPQKVRELTELLACYRPTEHEMYAMARSMCHHGANEAAAAFHHKHVDRLASQAMGLYTAAQNDQLTAFGKHLTLEEAAVFVLADDAALQLQKAVSVGQAVEKYLAPALLLSAMAGGVIALATGAIPAVPASIGVAVGVVVAAVVEVVFHVSVTELLDDALDIAGRAAGDAAAHLTMKIIAPKVKAPALPVAEAVEIDAEA